MEKKPEQVAKIIRLETAKNMGRIPSSSQPQDLIALNNKVWKLLEIIDELNAKIERLERQNEFIIRKLQKQE